MFISFQKLWFNLFLINGPTHELLTIRVCIYKHPETLVGVSPFIWLESSPTSKMALHHRHFWLVYKFLELIFSSDLFLGAWECNQRSVFGSLWVSYDGLLHCLQRLQQTASDLWRILLWREAAQDLHGVRRFRVRGKEETGEKETPRRRLLWSGCPHHWLHRTHRSGGRDRPADVEGDGLHRGEHHRHGDALGGFMDELLQAGQHPDAV